MEKCASINHKEIDAISFCGECKLYFCNKCDKFHSEIFQNHNIIKLEKGKDIGELFTGFCKEKNHKVELKYFCKKHNELCCAECITKLKGKENGQHSDCDIYFIEDIEKDKRNKLKKNIKCLEDISTNLEMKINEIKAIYEKIEKNKEESKENIQKIFTKLRNSLNNREDEILLEIDDKYNKLYFNIDIIRECDKLSNKIKISLEKGKEIENNWDNNKLKILIFNCINIEKNIKEINLLNKNIEKISDLDINFKFNLEESKVNKLLDSIKIFGKIVENKFDTKIDFDEKLVKSWLDGRKFMSELLYRKSRDGSTPDDFHNKCDNKGITMTIIETTKGNKFGGYTESSWDKSDSSKNDKSIFLFSFSNKKKETNSNKSSIYCSSDEGPIFDLVRLKIQLGKNLDEGESIKKSIFQTDFITNDEGNWDVKELEVHQIRYI